MIVKTENLQKSDGYLIISYIRDQKAFKGILVNGTMNMSILNGRQL